MPNAEILICQPKKEITTFEERVVQDTLWLSQAQKVCLFDSTKQNISLHINNIFKGEELDYKTTVKESLTVQKEGIRTVKRKVLYYNLDVIISVGYRVKSVRCTQFRTWANKVLKDYQLKGYTVNNKLDNLEQKVNALELKTTEIDFQIKTNLPQNEGIFYDGQIFDAFHFVSSIIKNATKSIILIDNYVDESVLLLLSNRKRKVSATFYTNTLTEQMKLDIQKHNSQFEKIQVNVFKKSHDKFLIIDQKDVYHIGASLKGIGKKWFAFAKININLETLISKLN
jgi:hypothetical protein